MVFNRLYELFSSDLAIDLGTATTLVYVKGKGVVATEPSVVAVVMGEGGGRRVIAVGSEAKNMLGREPGHLKAIRPVKDGEITQLDVTEAMLKYFIDKVHGRRALVRPRIVLTIPHGSSDVLKLVMKSAAENAGAREVILIEEPMAAAIGAGLPITDACGNMIVDIGGGTTEVAVISLGGIVVGKSVKVGGDKIDDAIIAHMRKRYDLIIGERTAEEIKKKIGSAAPLDKTLKMEVKGRSHHEGVPKVVTVSSDEIREAVSEPVDLIIRAILETLEKTSAELSGDITDRGLVLAGGGSLLRGLDRVIREKTGLPVIRAEYPIKAVVLGAGKILEDMRLLSSIHL